MPPPSPKAVVAPGPPARNAASFPGVKGFEAYRQLYAPGADVEATNAEFYAAVETRIAGPLVFSHRVLRNVLHSRDLARVGRNTFTHATLGFIHSGEIELQIEQDRRTLRAGAVFLLDMTRPARYWARADMTTVSLPRTCVPEQMLGSGRLHGASVSGGAARPLTDWLHLHSHGRRAEAALTAALRAAFQPAANDAMRPAEGRRDRLDEIREQIEAGLTVQGFSPSLLAKHLGMSRASLYRAFQPLGSVQQWRQGRRLLHFKAGLAYGAKPIAQAANDAGMEDPAQASALFSKMNGMSPTEFRRRAARVGEGADGLADLIWTFENIPVITLRGQS